jgi:pyruvate kinase
MTRRTKIVATVGPASDAPAVLEAMVVAGVDVFRLGLAHGTIDDHIARLARVRAAAVAQGRTVGVLGDLPGPKVRAAAFEDGGTVLGEGTKVRLAPAQGSDRSDSRRIAVDHATLLSEIVAGDKVALGDGGVELMVETVDGDSASAVVLHGGRVEGRPGVNLPPERFSLASPTPNDLRLLDAVASVGIDAVAASFVRSGADVRAVKQASGPDGPIVIAKIETASAVDDLDHVIEESDGVMVARGDLGIRLPFEDVPHVQRKIIKAGVAYARPVITATQMLESMITAPRPTRAEVSDVASAVLDGSSALMLSAETAIGRDPVEAVRTMARIIERAEIEFDHLGWGRNLGRQQISEAQGADPTVRITAAISAAAWRAAVEVDAAAIIACTNSGSTARSIARFRPTAPIIAATPSPLTARRLAMAWGVETLVVDRQGSTDEIVWFAVQAASEAGLVRSGDVVAVLVGSPVEDQPMTDVLRLVRVR